MNSDYAFPWIKHDNSVPSQHIAIETVNQRAKLKYTVYYFKVR